MNDRRSNIIYAINSPLGFFVLSLLIVEGFLAITLVFSKEPNDLLFNLIGLIAGAGLFILVVILVWIIVWNKPENLTLKGEHYFELQKRRDMRDIVMVRHARDSTTTKKDEDIIKKYYKIYVKE